ncbi:MAG: secretin N-terminal domain-containing protein [Armatimonadota bacterium]
MPTTAGRFRGRRLALCLAVAGALAVTAAMAYAAGPSSVTGVNLERQGEVLLVNVELRGPVAYATQMLEEPKRFVVDLQRTTLAAGQPARFPVDYGPVREVSIGPRGDEAGSLRLMVLLAGNAACEARARPDGGLVIAVAPQPGAPSLAARGDRPGPRLAAPGGGLGEALWRQFLVASRALREAEPAPAPVVLAAHTSPPRLTTAGPVSAGLAAIGGMPPMDRGGARPAASAPDVRLASAAEDDPVPRLFTLARGRVGLSQGLRLPEGNRLAATDVVLRGSRPGAGPARTEAPAPRVAPLPLDAGPADPGASGPPPGRISTAPRIAQAPTTPAAGGPDPLDIQFVGAEISEILAALAQYSGRNIVVCESVTGTIPLLDLRQVSLERALDYVTKPRGYDYVLVDENTYVVGTPEDLAKFAPEVYVVGALSHTFAPQNTTPARLAARFNELYADTGIVATPASDMNLVVFTGIADQRQLDWLQTALPELDAKAPDTFEIVTVQYIPAGQAADQLQRWLPDVTASVPADIRANVVRLEGPPEIIDQAKQILTMLDVDPATQPTVLKEPTWVVKPIDYLNMKDVVALVSQQFGEDITIQEVEGAGEEPLEIAGDSVVQGRMNMVGRVILRGEKSLVDEVIAFIDMLDVPRPQVQIRGMVAEVRRTKDTDRGFAWEFPGLVFREESVSDGYKFGRLIRDTLDPFSAIFSAITTDTKARILAEPKIVAEHEKTGSILVGSIIPYETTIPGEGTVTRSLNFQEIGLSIEFLPIVHSDDTVQLYLVPKVSTFTGFTPAGFPEVSTREAATIMHIADGEIIVVGGLFQDEEIVTKSGVPFLKDWPLIGELFSFRSKSRIKTEIIFMAEITIVRRPAAGSAVAAAAGAEGAG